MEEAKADGNPSLAEIRPPRLDDAGLEDCALPPDSIREAFFKAAAAVGSRLSHDDEIDHGDDSESQADPSQEASEGGENERVGDGKGDGAVKDEEILRFVQKMLRRFSNNY